VRPTLLALLLLAACSGRPDGESAAAVVGGDAATVNPCGAPSFAAGECVTDVVNGGMGPDAVRQICDVGGQRWVLYPSGEQWHMLVPGPCDEVGCPRPIVFCHGFPDGGAFIIPDGG